LSGKQAKAARRAAAAQAASGKRGRKVQAPKKYEPTTVSPVRRGLWLLLAVPVVVEPYATLWLPAATETPLAR